MLVASRPQVPETRGAIGRPVRVCFLLDCLGVAGIECQVLLLLQHLDRTKIQPYLCLLRSGDGQRPPREVHGCPVITLGVESLHRLSVLPKALQFARFLRNEEIDVLQPLHTDSLYFGTPVAKFAGVPSVVRFRVDLGYWMKRSDRWLCRALNPLLDATLANCDACRQVSVEKEWAPYKSVAIIPNGVDLSRFPEASPVSSNTGGPREKRVGIVANLRPVKNLDVLIRAAGLLKASHPRVRYLIAGEGDQRPQLASLIDELKLHDCVDLVGSVADIPSFLQTLDVAVLCSRSEGSPNSIMEYMAAARPIVATAVGGCGELLTHETHGLLVPPGDVEQLAAAIDRLLSDSDLAGRLGANARQRALAEFGVELQARRYEMFYRNLILEKTCRI